MTLPQWHRLYVPLLLAVLLVIPAVAFPESPAEQRPCAGELERFCRDVQPGEGRIMECLQEHDRDLSAACRDKVNVVLARQEVAKQACLKDIEKFCADVTPGGERLMKCLKPHLRELSPHCREKFGRFRARLDSGKKRVQ